MQCLTNHDGNMDKKTQDIAFFISFCLEQYKTSKGISGQAAMRVFDQYHVLEYLERHYEVLHSQSRQWILEDIDDFINQRTRVNQ